jgi:transporter family-2 protein
VTPGFDGRTVTWEFRRMWASTVLAVGIGALLAVQGVLNARVGGLLGRPIHAALVSLAVGMVSLLILAGAMGDGLPPIARLRQLPAPYWTAGALGAVYVASVILLVPKIGSATLIAASVAGQFVMALLLDHYGWLGLASRPIDGRRLLGVACLGLGVWLLQKK